MSIALKVRGEIQKTVAEARFASVGRYIEGKYKLIVILAKKKYKAVY